MDCLTHFFFFSPHAQTQNVLACRVTHTRADTEWAAAAGQQQLADAAVLLYFLTLECLSLMIIVNLIDAVTWSVMGFQVIAEPVWKEHTFFLRRKGASAEPGLRKGKKKEKKHATFWLAFLSILSLSSWNANALTPRVRRKRDTYSFFFLPERKLQHLCLGPFSI